MQTIELASRLIKRWGMSLANMPVDVQQSLLDCINAGLQNLYAEAPPVYREAPFGGILAAPQTINLNLTNGSNTFTGWVPTSANYFATARIPTDTFDNLVIPPSGLLNAFEGTTGTQAAIIYGDTIPLPANIERIIDEPALMGTRYRLARNDEYWGGSWGSYNEGGFWFGPFNGGGQQRRVAIPRTYWVEPNAYAQASSGPAFVLRVDPLPSSLYQIRGRALFYPPRLLMGALQANQQLPLNDAWVERLLIPLILAEMADYDLWKDKTMVGTTQKKGEVAMSKIQKLSPVIDKPNSRVETERGW